MLSCCQNGCLLLLQLSHVAMLGQDCQVGRLDLRQQTSNLKPFEGRVFSMTNFVGGYATSFSDVLAYGLSLKVTSPAITS